MKLTELAIDNFRNLSGVTFPLHPDLNFIIGDNNLGKSNVLDLIEKIFINRPFVEADFFEKTKPIKVSVKIKIEDFESGIFDDITDPADDTTLTLQISQESPDENFTITHTPTGTELNPRALSRSNFFSYSSTRGSEWELGFDRTKGASKFLNRILRLSTERSHVSDDSVLVPDEAEKLIKELQKIVGQIRAFSQFDIEPGLISGELGILSRIVGLSDAKKIAVSEQGHGVLSTAVLSLVLLERIALLVDKDVQIQTKGKIKLRTIFALDEPEVHVHPFLQRSLVRYLHNICCDLDPEFQKFIKELFQLDSFGAQIITATHSSSVFSENFRHIIRFHKKSNGSLSVVSGLNIKLAPQEEKHLHKTFAVIRETFFARAAIIVEGDTEIGAFPVWFRKLGLDPDAYGISFVDAKGKGSVRPLLSLLKQFSIPSYAVVDRDDGTQTESPILEITQGRDFEDDLVTSILKSNPSVFDTVLSELGFGNRFIQKSKLEEVAKKYGVSASFSKDLTSVEAGKLSADVQRVFYIALLNVEKGIVLGKILGEQTSGSEIPAAYQQLIQTTKELLKNVRPYF